MPVKPDPPLQLANFRTQPLAQRRIKIAERLVEQHNSRFVDQRNAPARCACCHATQLVRMARGKVSAINQLEIF